MSVRITEAASLLGVTPRAVRHYEAKGLVDPPRDRWDCRYYDPATRERLRFIVALRRAGLPLRDVREALELGAYDPEAQARYVAAALQGRARALEQSLAEVRQLAAAFSEPAAQRPRSAA